MIRQMASSALVLALLSTAAIAQTNTPSNQPAESQAQPAPQATQPAPAAAPPAPQAQAQAPTAATPTTPEDCVKQASDLAQNAEDKNLADDKLDKIEELLTKMETHCEAKQFSEAAVVAKDIKTMIDGQ